MPKGLVLLLLFAKLEKPDCPKAGVDPVPVDAAAQGELFAPICDDCPKPIALGLPKAGAEEGAALLKPLDPNTAPPVLGAAALEPPEPQSEGFCPS